MSTGRLPILVTAADLAPQALALLTDYDVVYTGPSPAEADIVSSCRQHDPVAIIVRYGKVGEAAMRAAPRLKVIAKHGSGTDTIDKVAASAHGVRVLAAAGANAAAVAEHAIALMLACAKSVVHLDERMRQGHWDKPVHKSLELEGRTIGLIGLGAIGLRVARIADAMGMTVIGFDPYAPVVSASIRRVALADIWRESDVISLHCPLTPENTGLINARTLALCKPGVILVNTARGGLVDEPALLEAVRTGQVAMVGLDSFAAEPMTSPHPFQQEKRLVLSPHIGGVTEDAYVKMGVGAARNALSVLQPQAVA